MPYFFVRKATPSDLAVIRKWLRREHEQGIEGCFWAHFAGIERAQREGYLRALIDSDDDRAVAFGTAYSDGLLAVRADRRGRGLGTRLAEGILAEARRAGAPGFYVRCAPSCPRVLRFWKRLGFTEVAAPGMVERFFARPNRGHAELPADAPRHAIRIQPWHEWKPIPLGPRFETAAAMTDGGLRLESHFVEYLDDENAMIEIRVDGREVSRRKVKYSGDVGVEWTGFWVRVTRLVLSEAG